jgi:hypothetical protein
MRVIFRGSLFTIIQNDAAEVLLVGLEPFSATCVDHGIHQENLTECPHVMRLLEEYGKERTDYSSFTISAMEQRSCA